MSKRRDSLTSYFSSQPLSPLRTVQKGIYRKPVFHAAAGTLVGIRHGGYGICHILDYAVENDVFEAIGIWGPKGAGKSNCALWTGYHVFSKKYPDLSEKEIWKQVLHHVIFKPSEFDAIIDEYNRKYSGPDGFEGFYDHSKRIPWLCIDDAGLHWSKYFWQDPELKRMGSFFDIVRVYIKILIYTTPRLNKVMSAMRESLLTGEIYVPLKKRLVFNPETGRRELVPVRGHGMFIRYIEVPDFKKIGAAYIIKNFINAFGREFTFPKVPDWVEREYNKRKGEAIKDQQTMRRILKIRKQKFLKQLEESLLPTDKKLLEFMTEAYGEGKMIGEHQLAEEFSKATGRKFTLFQIKSSLASLKSLNLVCYEDYKWGVTREGIEVANVWKSRAVEEEE